jgi:ATP synthase protein I
MLRLVFLQIILSVLASVVAAIGFGAVAGVSCALGAAACAVPNLFFALSIALKTKLARLKNQHANPFSFLMGEMIKIVASVLLLFTFAKWYAPLVWPAFIAGMVVALKAYLIAVFFYRTT